MRVNRVDVGARLRADHKTVQGNARIPANLTRTGVFLYQQEDGTMRREWRPPEEVFKPDSLKTLETAALTIGHPGTVSPDNWKNLSVGEPHNIKRDGIYVAAELVVRDAEALKGIDNGDYQELSCGYDCMLTFKSGTTPEGERYDAIQSDIRYNHVGLGPKNWGRAGSEVRLRLDGGVVAYEEDASSTHYTANMLTPEQIAALQAELTAAKKRADDLQAKLDGFAKAKDDEAVAALRKELETAKGERDKLAAKIDGLEKTSAPSAVAEIVKKRVAVIDGARLLHGKTDIALEHADKKEKTSRELMVEAIVVREPDFKADGKSDDYVQGRFDFWTEQVKKGNEGLGKLNAGTSPGTLERNDGDDMQKLAKHFDGAEDRLKTYMTNAWRGDAAAQQAVDGLSR